MKVGSPVLFVHVVVLCVFALTQGCVTTESQGSGRGAGARHKGPWKHDHKGKATSSVAAYPQDTFDYGQDDDMGSIYDPVIESSTDNSAPEPYVDPASSMTESYIVQKGDILSQLAVDFDTTVPTLVELNNLSNPDVLYVGQELRVPPGRTGGKKMAVKSSSAIIKGGTYVVQKGDTLSEIALAAGVSIDDLRSLNNIQDDKIFADQKLSIPSYGKVPSAARKSSAPQKSAPAPVEPAAPAVAEPALAPMAPAAPVEPEVTPVETAMAVDMVQDHVVYPGETLDDIARQHGASKSEIMRMNNITDETAVREGQRLRIPIAE